ncbi:MAG: ribonuclease H-like YkuK family protein [bacterium]|nr:ribonuclease H-like YkuK family protein [bacterium]
MLKNLEQDVSFTSPTKGLLSLTDSVEEIVDFFKEDPDVFYTLVIGTDSQTKRDNGSSEVDFVTAIVIHRQGKGGRYFWRKVKDRKIYALREKIFTETYLSLELAHKLVPLLRDALIGLAPYELEIHIDVGEVGPTRDMIKEVVGMVTGNGFTAKTKPQSFGAFCVADKHT